MEIIATNEWKWLGSRMFALKLAACFTPGPFAQNVPAFERNKSDSRKSPKGEYEKQREQPVCPVT
jgi:hypothetical protein